LGAELSLEDLVLMPERCARRALAPQSMTFALLAPLGAYAGRGVLRVLRARQAGDAVELVCGYESYARLEDAGMRLAR
jgi:hypothetical protein